MRPSRIRLNLLAPVELAWETAAIEISFETGPECAPKFQVFIWYYVSKYFRYIEYINYNNMIEII